MKLRIKLRNYKMNHFQHIKSQIPTFPNLSFQEYQHVFCLESLARNSREEERLAYCKFFVTQNQSVFTRDCFCRKYREFRLINNAWESLTSHFCALRSVVLELFIQFPLQSDTIYFSSFEWLTLGFFAYPCYQRAVTRLENVRQLNITRGKKLGFQLSHKQPFIVQYLVLGNNE